MEISPSLSVSAFSKYFLREEIFLFELRACENKNQDIITILRWDKLTLIVLVYMAYS